MSSKDQKKLPDGWIICNSKSTPGKQYYFNRKTGKSSWTYPEVDDKHDNSNKKISKSKQQKKYQNKKRKKSLKRKNDGEIEQNISINQSNKANYVCIPEKNATALVKQTEQASRNTTPTVNIVNLKNQLPRTSKSNSLETTPTKNLANARLQKLRTSLTSEASNNDQICTNKEELPKNSSKRKIHTDSSEFPCKISKVERSTLNDTKTSGTSLSPSTDNLQTSPSPSQFFAANKIICSMKAQLPDEYRCKIKQKDAFAEIEERICSQMSEYPSAKHPSTPPQFSEANKLVSAIKSKLSYNFKESDVQKFTSAKERMEALRANISNESVEPESAARTTCQVSITKESVKQMDVDIDETSSTNVTKKPEENVIEEELVLVVDTNIFIHELNCIQNVLNSHVKGYNKQPTLLVPWRVVSELDRLKDNNNGNGAICKRARAAMDYLYKLLPENSRIKGQSLRDANSHIYPCESPDDEILNCCLQQKEREKNVVLLSNDKNLCNKAMTNNVKFMSLNELKVSLVTRPQEVVDPDLETNMKHYKDSIYQLLSNILENEMRATYNNFWQHVLFKAPPWTLSDVLQCLLKHWIAVFNDVFPRIEHLITDLKNALEAIEKKDPKRLCTSEVTNFKELCLDVAKRCQIIPEYMRLAKMTVNRLERKDVSETESVTKGEGDMVVINAFEGVWTVFSSYCAKLSTGVGIAHNLEDKLTTNDPIEVLIDRYPEYSSQINALARALNSVISVEDPSTERLAELETVFKESLALIHLDRDVINKENIRRFCVNYRNMLQEACTKFLQLTELLEACGENISHRF